MNRPEGAKNVGPLQKNNIDPLLVKSVKPDILSLHLLPIGEFQLETIVSFDASYPSE